MHGRPAPSTVGDTRTSHPNRWRILIVLVTALLVTSIDHTIINVALPGLVDDLGATAADLQWVVAAYTVVFAGLLLTAGSLGDRFGRRRALIVGVATFLAGSVASALAGSTTALIAGRGVMGVGGALIMPTTLSILVNAFGDPRERARAIATWTAVSGAGIALGPIVGGALMRSFSWSAVFWINVPLLAIALVGALHVVPESRDPHATRLDPVGAVLSTVAIGSLVYAIIDGPEAGWTSASTMVWFMVAAMAGGMFAHWELRRDDPMLDLRLFRHRGFSAGSSTLAILFFAMAGAVFLQAQYLQFVLDYTPLAAGTALVPAAIGMVLGTGAGAHLADRFGGRLAVVTGTLLAAGGIAAQAALVDGTGYVPTGVGLFLFGLGAGVAMPAATELIMATLPPARAGVGSAVNDTVREVGGALGVAVIGSVAAAAYAANLDDIPDVSMLPDGVQAAVTDNVGAALHVSHRLGADGARLADAARQAFVDAMTGSLWIAAGVALSASVIAFFHLPRQAEDAHEVAELPGNRPRVHAAVMLAVAVGVAVLLTACGADPKPAAQASPPSTTVAAVERPTAPVDRMVRTIDGRMHLRCVGEGDTTVLLIAGWGAAGDGWGRIEPTIRERARVCSYDRYGTGASDAPPSSQTFADQAADLEALLRTAGEPGPYVVLGHSFGGAEAVTFAAQRPAHVTGLVLLDASPVTWPSAVCAVPDDGTDTAAEFRLTCDQMRHPAHNAEHLDAVDAFDEVAEIDSLGDLPLIVVTASQRTFPGLAADQLARLNGVWNDGVDRWASLSTASTVVSVDDTGHDIQLDQPQVVIDQIEALLP